MEERRVLWSNRAAANLELGACFSLSLKLEILDADHFYSEF